MRWIWGGQIYFKILQPFARQSLLLYFRCKGRQQKVILTNGYRRCRSAPIIGLYANGSACFYLLRWCLVARRSSMINVHSFSDIRTIEIHHTPCFCCWAKDDWTCEEAGGHGGGSSRREAAADWAGGGGAVSATRGHGTKSTLSIQTAYCWLEKYNTFS